MRKYILSESQIKKIVDKIIAEQSDNRSTVMTVQCFLNQVESSNLVIDGKAGPNSLTEKALKAFQMKKNKLGNNINVDGIWGYNTQSTLTPDENNIWKQCRRKYTLNESQLDELYKSQGHEYEILKIGHDTIKAGKDGILGDNDVFISWDIIIKLLDKFKK